MVPKCRLGFQLVEDGRISSLEIVKMSGLTIKDLERLSAQNPDYRMELVGGEIIVMSPSGLESDEVAAAIIAQLSNWVRPRKLGRVTASSAGFRLPNAEEDVRAPDASFIRAERLKRTTQDYAQLVPDLIFEVKSKTDSLTKLRQKIQDFLVLGTQVGVLVDPRPRTMEVYRLGSEKVVLQDRDILTVPELLPGWELPVADVWAPEFE
jgi:Uma2 family endonuclease